MIDGFSMSSNVRLAQFIERNIEPILVDWEAFAKTRIPAAATMSMSALRDHAERILRAIAADMESPQTEPQRDTKSRGLADALDASETAATAHGALRHIDGFDLVQVVSEFRAMRAAVLRQWRAGRSSADVRDIEDITRFNEAMDQALAESIAAYSAGIGESRDTFLAVLGHDLRGPLGAMSNCVHLLQRPDIAPTTKDRMLHIAARSVSSMSSLITDLLEYTRTRLGKGIEVVARTGDFASFCDELVEEARAGHPKRAFTYAQTGALPAVFDADRMRQVLGNLLQNAVQHGRSDTPVDVVAADEGTELVLTVANQGRPIPADALQVIFNPLVQIAKTSTEPHERPSTSMGLGLFIALEIVKAHRGTIDVASSADGGTVFTVRLPKDGPGE